MVDAKPFDVAPLAPAIAAPPVVAPPTGPFAGTTYRFTTGLRAGELAHVRDANGAVLLSYRSFASVVGILAALVSGIVLLTGFAATLFLALEAAPFRAFAALALTVLFACAIALLVPRTNVTLYDDAHPALTIAQRSLLPRTFVVATPNGTRLAELRHRALSRFGRDRWWIVQDNRFVGQAVEESFVRAVRRKLFGKFSRRSESNLRLELGGLAAGAIVRRPSASGAVDRLELTSDALDRRVAVALALLILGREP
ncbi:MAG: hypothetical protein JO197_12310 [Acidobacteria bacterium]|nr:hypothetical protein [Acidobacteriota bacterium]MBV9478347.1 hypothetical protein [Acidobacteriota bacterium]